jgi:glycosyltransferase 2 family protein
VSDETNRRWLRIAGGALAISCVIWIVSRFVREDAWRVILESGHGAALAGTTALAAAVYCCSLCLLAIAWWCIQCAFSDESPSMRRFFAIYATTQFAKYLPGNVGHYLGRHLLARRQGASSASLIAGVGCESLLLVCAACVWAGAGLRSIEGWPRHIDMDAGWLRIAIALLLACVLSIAAWSLPRFPAVRRWAPLQQAAWLVPAWCLHLLFFAGMACSLLLVSPLSSAPIDFGVIATAAATGWIAGYLAVGAPAGIGVREAVLVIMLRDTIPEADLLIAIAAFRISTVSGDCLLFAIGWRMGGLQPDRVR